MVVKMLLIELFNNSRWWQVALTLVLAAGLLFFSSCFPENKGETYYGRVVVPKSQEFRWSDGGLPKIFDPALAVAPPDTDAVRAMFEGLTDYDRKTLTPLPGVAERWESANDSREWIFYLRKNARWSNGDPVTANDFVRSWQRTLQLKDRAPHAKLMAGIKGVKLEVGRKEPMVHNGTNKEQQPPKATPTPTEEPLGVKAINDHTLHIHLQRPIKEFPSLVSHPVFSPVHSTLGTDQSIEKIVTNGAFHLTKVDQEGVVLERANNYWDASDIKLERVRFVAKKDAESALNAYREGEIDAVTNSALEPLALKLLTPHNDFRRETYATLTYYIFNPLHPLLKDLRIRRALALAIDRKRLTDDTADGITQPATSFLPAQFHGKGSEPSEKVEESLTAVESSLDYNPELARQLMAEAGYPLGEGFPNLRLVINRNDQHRMIAQAIIVMWKNVLGINAQIILKNWMEYEEAIQTGNYDIARRSLVMQTADESTNILAMFDMGIQETPLTKIPGESPTPQILGKDTEIAKDRQSKDQTTTSPLVSEAQALKELPAIPIYFASSYALVKPYVDGFETDLFDAPSLKQVSINTSWQQKH
jgi:oligopeptide transport system substrate-binding protein